MNRLASHINTWLSLLGLLERSLGSHLGEGDNYFLNEKELLIWIWIVTWCSFWFPGFMVQSLVREKKFLFDFWVVISWLTFTLKLNPDYAEILIQELIHLVWISIKLKNLIASIKLIELKIALEEHLNIQNVILRNQEYKMLL